MTPNYNIHLIFSYISLFSILIPFVVGLLRYRHFSPDARVMFFLVLAAILVETIIFTLHRYHINNLFVLRINTIVEFSLLSMFFTHVFRNFSIIVVIRLLILAFVGVAVFDLQLNGIDRMDNVSSAVESIMLMLYSLLGFYYQITRPKYSNILATPLFWFNTAILIYFSGDLFLFIFTNYVRSHLSSFSYALWDIHSFVNILFYILISVGFWKTKLPANHSVKSMD